MNSKKSKNADLEGKRLGFGILGSVIAVSIVLMAFTFKSIEIKPIAQLQDDIEKLVEEDIIEFTDIAPPPPPPPPPVQAPPPLIEEVEEVEDDIEVEVVDEMAEELIDPGADYEETEEVETTVIHDVVAVSPEYPGGPAEMGLFIQRTFEYPEMAKEMGEQGTIWVEFVVYSDGKIKDVRVVKGVSESLDKEAMRVVKRMPKWKPGEQAGKAVNVRYTIPIKAKLG